MSQNLEESKLKNLSSLNYNTDIDNSIPIKKKYTIFFRDTIKQFCPYQRYIDRRPYPFRNAGTPYNEFNYYNNPTEKETYFSCFHDYKKRELVPLVTRQDLNKYINNNSRLLKHKKPCKSCTKIKNGNYGINYYTIKQKSFPFINGNFTGTNFRITNKYGTPYQTRNNEKFKFRIRNGDYNNINNNNYDSNIDNNRYENNNNNFNSNNNSILSDNGIGNNERINKLSEMKKKMLKSHYTPNIRKSFRKTQIFNYYKPFMVDDFQEFGKYE